MDSMQIRRPNDLAALIRSARSARGLSQQELADRLGTSRWWVTEMERGKSTARLDLVLRALNELDVTLTASISEASALPLSEPPDLIDIDAIADTGLSGGRGSQVRPRRGR